MPLGAQAATGTKEVLLVEQVVATKLGPTGVTGVHVATGVGPLKVVGAQVVLTQELPLVGPEAAQLATRVGPVGLGVQVVSVQPLAKAGWLAVQAEAPAGPVVVTGQVVVM